MGTNYYLQPAEPCCPHCQRAYPTRHIGKSSFGWCFTLHVYPAEGINTLDDWYELFIQFLIKDEYGRIISIGEMVDIITNCLFTHPTNKVRSELVLDMNDAIDGPNGLMRHKISDFCIGHGSGTWGAWDYCVGDFS